MTKQIGSFGVWGLVFLVVLGVAPRPRSANADEAAIDAAEVRLVRQVSRELLGVQKAERELAKQVGLPAIEGELRRLARALTPLAATGGSPESPALQRGDSGRAAATVRALSVQPEQEERVRGALLSLGDTKTKLENSLDALKSPRQRRVARRAAEKLAALEAEVEAALASPPAERCSRLLALRQRLVVQRYGLGDPTPLDKEDTAGWRVVERPPNREESP